MVGTLTYIIDTSENKHEEGLPMVHPGSYQKVSLYDSQGISFMDL